MLIIANGYESVNRQFAGVEIVQMEKRQNKRIKCVQNAYKPRNIKQICGKQGQSQGLACVIVYVVQSTHSVKNTEYRT